jgi:hypothetical protein
MSPEEARQISSVMLARGLIKPAPEKIPVTFLPSTRTRRVVPTPLRLGIQVSSDNRNEYMRQYRKKSPTWREYHRNYMRKYRARATVK